MTRLSKFHCYFVKFKKKACSFHKQQSTHHTLSVTALTDRSHLSIALGLMPSHPMDHLTAVCLESCFSWDSLGNVKCPCICAQFRHMTLVSTFKVFLAVNAYGPLSAPSLSHELVTHTRFMIHRKYSEKADNNPTIKISTKKKPLLGVSLHFYNPLRQGLTV